MGLLLDRLAEKKILVSDGAWGTMLQAKGLTTDECPEEWNVTHPEHVQAVAAAYAHAGCDMVLTNTFGGSRLKLEKRGLGERVGELNRAGARNSLTGAPAAVVVGSIGPTGEFLEPLGDLTLNELDDVFGEQIEALFAGGLTALCIETMSAVEEAACAVRVAKKINPQADVAVTMTFSAAPQGWRTMMGVTPRQAVEELVKAGADIVGANCGNGIEQMVEIAKEFRKHTHLPILIHANAGLPELVGGRTVFKQTPEDMAAKVKNLVEAGANIIGGCCGTTPEHIVAMKKAVNRFR